MLAAGILSKFPLGSGVENRYALGRSWRTAEVSDQGLSKELTGFIAAHVKSSEHLEVLLLLSGNPHKHWTSRSVYDVVKTNPTSIQQRLNEFTLSGVLVEEKSAETYYRFNPSIETLWPVINELREEYKQRPVKIVEAIYAKPPEGVDEFAKAFRLRKEK